MELKNIPKLEVKMALYAVRLRQLFPEGQDIDNGKMYFCTNSLTVLQWLRSAYKRQHVLVANRIAEIMESLTADE